MLVPSSLPFHTSGINTSYLSDADQLGEIQAELVECVDPIKLEGIHACFWQIHLGIQIHLNKIIS